MDKKLTKTRGLLKWLSDNGHTVEETQKEWDAAIAANVGGLVGWLHREGYDWRYLQTYQINSLFGLAERTIEKRKVAEEERKRKEEEERKRKEEEEEERKRKEQEKPKGPSLTSRLMKWLGTFTEPDE